MALAGRHMQRGAGVEVAGLEGGLAGEQELDDADLVHHRGVVQRGHALGVDLVQVGARLQQLFDHGAVAGAGGLQQGRLDHRRGRGGGRGRGRRPMHHITACNQQDQPRRRNAQDGWTTVHSRRFLRRGESSWSSKVEWRTSAIR